MPTSMTSRKDSFSEPRLERLERIGVLVTGACLSRSVLTAKSGVVYSNNEPKD